MIVLDASVVLATEFGESGAIDWTEVYERSAISAFNLGEVVSKLVERGHDAERTNFLVELLLPISHVLTSVQAIRAGTWRMQTRRFGLSMGDRCCLALGLEFGAEVYTADRAWADLDLGVKVRVIR
jgi:PIN domain nuclease of toxin-antitoxin system